ECVCQVRIRGERLVPFAELVHVGIGRFGQCCRNEVVEIGEVIGGRSQWDFGFRRDLAVRQRLDPVVGDHPDGGAGDAGGSVWIVGAACTPSLGGCGHHLAWLPPRMNEPRNSPQRTAPSRVREACWRTCHTARARSGQMYTVYVRLYANVRRRSGRTVAMSDNVRQTELSIDV